MAEKIKYTVNRSMQDGATSYNRGDTRELTAHDAAFLLASGALSLPGEEPAVREPGVQHTFGSRPSSVNGYTSPSPETAIEVPTKASAPAKPKR